MEHINLNQEKTLNIRLDILEEIKEKIGSYPIVLHGSSSCTSRIYKKNLKNLVEK
mgnify:CR=1 FL=1